MLDGLCVFSDDQAITASAASTNYIKIMEFLGRGEPVEILVRVTVDFATLTSLKVGVQTDTANTFGSPTTVAETAAIAAASLVEGYEFKLRFLPNVEEEYLRLYFTVAGDSATAGKVFAAVVVGGDHPLKDGLYFSPRNTTGAASTA